MIRDFKYIIKRILIGVGIALVLSFLRGGLVLQAHAQTIGSYSIGEQIDVINNNNNLVYYNISGAPWANYGDGYLIFDFSVFKVAGSSTSPNVMPSYVRVNSGNVPFVCSVGSSSVENSTFNNLIFSAFCPVHLSSSGVSSISIGFQNNQQNSTSDARVYFNGLLTYEQKVADTDIDYNSILGTINANANANSQYTQQAINNASSSITNNQNSNTQNIINNQNSNTDKEIESQKVCKNYDKASIITDKRFLTVNGLSSSNDFWGITDYLNVSNSIVKISSNYSGNSAAYMCFYNDSKTLISCSLISSLASNTPLTLPSGTFYMRTSIAKSMNLPQFTICKNGNQAIVDSQQDINNSINDDNVSGANSTINDFFNDFDTGTNGNLTDIISLPLDFLQSLNNTCSSLPLNLGQLGNYNLPCIKSVLTANFPTALIDLITLLVNGFLCYRILSSLMIFINNLKDPNNADLEVMDL